MGSYSCRSRLLAAPLLVLSACAPGPPQATADPIDPAVPLSTESSTAFQAVIGRITADGRTTWPELREAFALGTATLMPDRIPNNYAARGHIDEHLPVRLKVRLVPPADDREIRHIQLVLDPGSRSSPCVDFESFRQWLGAPVTPPVPVRALMTIPASGEGQEYVADVPVGWVRSAEGQVNGVPIEAISSEEIVSCVESVSLDF